MNTEESFLTPQESLELIAQAIRNTKNNFKEFSFCFILWGWLIGIASISFFLLHQFTHFPYFYLPFPVLALTGILVTLVWIRKKETISSQSFLTFFLIRLWLVLGLGFIFVVFISIARLLPPFPYTLLIGGIGTLVSGWVMKFRPLIIGGLIFLVSSVASIFIPADYMVLLMGGAVFAGYLIPGYLLRSSND